jgi:hypothetical protein
LTWFGAGLTACRPLLLCQGCLGKHALLGRDADAEAVTASTGHTLTWMWNSPVMMSSLSSR